MTLDVGASKVLTASVLPVGASQSLNWYTSDAVVATIDGDQNVIAKSPGTADISARTPNGIESICKVTVKADPLIPVSVVMSETEVWMDWQTVRQLSASVLPVTADQTIIWTTSNEFLLPVDSTGLVTPKNAGVATITATASNGAFAECVVNITIG